MPSLSLDCIEKKGRDGHAGAGSEMERIQIKAAGQRHAQKYIYVHLGSLVAEKLHISAEIDRRVWLA